METLGKELHENYLSTSHNFEPLFNLEAFKLCSDSTFPSLIFWGSDFNCYYNESFARLMKITHSTFFGKEGRSVFCKEAWKFFEPQLESVLETQLPIGIEGQLVYMDRKGFLEECYFDINFEPVMVGDLAEGVFCTLIESTKRILDQRRLELLTQLSNETLKATSVAHACDIITNILGRFTSDVPFTLTYLLNAHEQKDVEFLSDPRNDFSNLFKDHEFGDDIKYVEGLKNNVSQAVLIPIKSFGQQKPFAMIILGISPTLEINDDYRAFHLLMARFLSTVLTKVHMIEMKQKDLIARDEFISIASHEFKTPITALKLRLALTKRKLNIEQHLAPTPEEMDECIKTANQQADRLTGLVDELLDMTRIQRGKFQFTYEEMELAGLFKEIINRFSDELQKTGNKIVLDVALGLSACWHRSRIDQLISNLITNSIKHAPGSNIYIKASCQDNQYNIEYMDDGPGIALDKQPKIFNRFVTGNSSQRVGGLGLGLYIVKEIVKGHHGEIQLQSAEGKGTKFVISLPKEP